MQKEERPLNPLQRKRKTGNLKGYGRNGPAEGEVGAGGGSFHGLRSFEKEVNK